MREDAVLQPGEEHDRELQALGGVQGHQGDHALVLGVVGGHLVGVGDQRDLLQEAGQASARSLALAGASTRSVYSRATLTSSCRFSTRPASCGSMLSSSSAR